MACNINGSIPRERADVRRRVEAEVADSGAQCTVHSTDKNLLELHLQQCKQQYTGYPIIIPTGQYFRCRAISGSFQRGSILQGVQAFSTHAEARFETFKRVHDGVVIATTLFKNHRKGLLSYRRAQQSSPQPRWCFGCALTKIAPIEAQSEFYILYAVVPGSDGLSAKRKGPPGGAGGRRGTGMGGSGASWQMAGCALGRSAAPGGEQTEVCCGTDPTRAPTPCMPAGTVPCAGLVCKRIEEKQRELRQKAKWLPSASSCGARATDPKLGMQWLGAKATGSCQGGADRPEIKT
eukprot:6208767-Pleurochrysis_carterae.AAC.1